jgi:hypothetical protein
MKTLIISLFFASSLAVGAVPLAAAAEMTEQECKALSTSIYSFLASAGIRDTDRLYAPLSTLMQNGSYQFVEAYVMNSQCHQKIIIAGEYRGNSYSQTVDGVLK